MPLPRILQNSMMSKTFSRQPLDPLLIFFRIFINDAITILGEPTYPCDIRAVGLMGQGEIFPHADLECIILVSQQDKYFTSLQEILTIQFLSIGKKVKFR